LRQRARQHAESALVADVQRGRREVRVIEHVGKGSLKPQAKTLGQRKLLGKTCVHVDLSRALQDFDGKFNALAEIFLLTHVLVPVEQKQIKSFRCKLSHITSKPRACNIAALEQTPPCDGRL
jgi:hypothetical protein